MVHIVYMINSWSIFLVQSIGHHCCVGWRCWFCKCRLCEVPGGTGSLACQQLCVLQDQPLPALCILASQSHERLGPEGDKGLCLGRPVRWRQTHWSYDGYQVEFFNRALWEYWMLPAVQGFHRLNQHTQHWCGRTHEQLQTKGVPKKELLEVMLFSCVYECIQFFKLLKVYMHLLTSLLTLAGKYSG